MFLTQTYLCEKESIWTCRGIRTYIIDTVIVDVDRNFQATDEWYEMVAMSRPPKNKPWYHVLVHDSSQVTYAAQTSLEDEDGKEPVVHPFMDHFFL